MTNKKYTVKDLKVGQKWVMSLENDAIGTAEIKFLGDRTIEYSINGNFSTSICKHSKFLGSVIDFYSYDESFWEYIKKRFILFFYEKKA